MRMQGRRASSNVRDIRGKGGMKMAGGLGLGGLLLVALFAYMTGGNPLNAVLNAVVESGGGGIQAGQTAGGGEYKPTAEEEELKTFAEQVLAGTEDVWSEIFAAGGKTYEMPTMMLFTDWVKSGCGGASKQVGPFYCSADRCVYLDLSFFGEMRDRLEAGGDFAYAYVIGHEVGHHVENLLGTLDDAHKEMARLKRLNTEEATTEANKISVRLELQADFFAGVWAHYDNVRFKSLEDGDIEEGINCAQKIGDDHLQKKAGGEVLPDSFTHGTSAARMKWFKKGYELKSLKDSPVIDFGKIMAEGNTFSVPFEDLGKPDEDLEKPL